MKENDFMSQSNRSSKRMLSAKLWVMLFLLLLVGAGILYYHHVRYSLSPSSPSGAAGSAGPESASTAQPASDPSLQSATSQDRSIDPMLDKINEALLKEIDEDERIRLLLFEAKMRKHLNSGWKPPWRGLEIKETEDEIRKMPTKELGIRLWATGIHARELLLYDNPNRALVRLKVFYKGYAELFSRPDLGEAMVAAIDASSSQLSPDNSDRANLSFVMALTTLPMTYAYPPISQALVGHEKELITAHVAALLRIKAFVSAVSARGSSKTAKLVTPRTVINLSQIALTIGERVWPMQAKSARHSMSQFEWTKEYSDENLARYIDKAVAELRALTSASSV
jgi:hypothetical protein